MEKKDILRLAMSSSQMVLPLLNDMKDDPLRTPTPNGGNHALWILGHLTFVEGWMFWDCMRGQVNPVDESWAELFGVASTPIADVTAYPEFDEIMRTFENLREQSLALLDTLSDEELEQKSANPPPGREGAFGRWWKCYLMAGLHCMNHRGQIADVRRAAGRDPLMA